MPKKAKNFKGFPASIPQKTIDSIDGKYRDIDEMIWRARCAAFAIIEGATSIDKVTSETVRIMYGQDMIRRDLDPAAFLVNRLYVALYGERKDLIVPIRVRDFYSEDDGAERYRRANERYEAFEAATEMRREVVTSSINNVIKQLAPKEEQSMLYNAMDRRFGFDPKQTKGYTYKQIAEFLRISEPKAKKTIQRGLDIIHESGLAASLEPSGLFAVTPLCLTEESAIENLCLTAPVYRNFKRRGIETIGGALEALKGRESVWGIRDNSLPKVKREFTRWGFSVDQ